MIYKLRVLLDTEKDVFRDIEVQGESNFEDLHFVILQAFGWQPHEMASFYETNDNWDKGEEIPLMDIQEEFGPKKMPTMSDIKIEEKLERKGEKMLYVFDFYLMWCFYLEVIDIQPEQKGIEYPQLVLEVGEAPHQMDKEPVDFSGDDSDEDGGDSYEDGYNPEDYSDLDFDEYSPN
ncbi:MAG: hypothetical protein KDC83_07230 [Flavobacteriales bacterium]|nr:hypothetical protein [Flavobacteriales bacterium]